MNTTETYAGTTHGRVINLPIHILKQLFRNASSTPVELVWHYCFTACMTISIIIKAGTGAMGIWEVIIVIGIN